MIRSSYLQRQELGYLSQYNGYLQARWSGFDYWPCFWIYLAWQFWFISWNWEG